MTIRSPQTCPTIEKPIHGGEGLALSCKLYGAEDFASGLRYVSRTDLPPGSSIGEHGHADAREEIYLILRGKGRVRIDDAERAVGPGDTILTRAGSTHALFNDGDEMLEVFVVWAL